MILCDVYKGTKREGVYIYVDRSQGLSQIPDELMARFGEPELALSFKLSSDRKLAKEDPEKVINAISSQGFFLQLPPQEHTF